MQVEQEFLKQKMGIDQEQAAQLAARGNLDYLKDGDSNNCIALARPLVCPQSDMMPF